MPVFSAFTQPPQKVAVYQVQQHHAPAIDYGNGIGFIFRFFIGSYLIELKYRSNVHHSLSYGGSELFRGNAVIGTKYGVW